MAIDLIEVVEEGVGTIGLGGVWIGIHTSGELAEAYRDSTHADNPAEVLDGMRSALLMPRKGQFPDVQPQFQSSQFPLNHAPGPEGWERWQVGNWIAGLGMGAIDFGQGGFHLDHSLAAFFAFVMFALDPGEVEGVWGEAGETAMGADGAVIGDERGEEVVGRAPARAHRGVADTTGGPARVRAEGATVAHWERGLLDYWIIGLVDAWGAVLRGAWGEQGAGSGERGARKKS